jgi:hypothetical protein
MSAVNSIISDSSSSRNSLPLVHSIIERNGREYGVEYFNSHYFLVSLIGSDLPAKQVARSEAAIDAAIAAFEEDMSPEPEPTPTAPAIVVRELVHIPAVAASSNERTIKIVAPEIIGVCDGFGATHWNLASELQDEPARYWQPGGTKKFCAHCYSAYLKSMGLYDKMQAEAAAEPQYVAVPKVAA